MGRRGRRASASACTLALAFAVWCGQDVLLPASLFSPVARALVTLTAAALGATALILLLALVLSCTVKTRGRLSPPRSINAALIRWALLAGVLGIELCAASEPSIVMFWTLIFATKTGATEQVRQWRERVKLALAGILAGASIASPLLALVVADSVRAAPTGSADSLLAFLVAFAGVAASYGIDPLARRLAPISGQLQPPQSLAV